MKAVLLAVGFLFLAGGFFIELWPLGDPPQEGWVCHEIGEEQLGNLPDGVYGCSTTYWDLFRNTSSRSAAFENDKSALRLHDGKLLAIIGVGFMVAAVAVGGTRAGGGVTAQPAAAPGNNPAATPPPPPVGQPMPVPAMPQAPGGSGQFPPPPGPRR